MDESKAKSKKSKPILRSVVRGGVRSKRNRIKKLAKQESFSILGSNAAGLKAKILSLKQTLKNFNYPSCVTIQETKMTHIGKIKIDDYQIFEKLRSGQGGGLLTDVKRDLAPVLVGNVNTEIEILIVQCQVGQNKLRIINAYGPQEDEIHEKRLEFWQALEEEIIIAKNENCMFLLQFDANAKLGNEIISGDPNLMSGNGHLLSRLI